MEDEYFLSADGSFSAVYDGHGGALVSKYLRQNLYNQVGGLKAYAKSLLSLTQSLLRL